MKKTTKQGEYEATAKVLGKPYTAKGSSISDCISKLSIRNAKGITLLVVKGLVGQRERILPPALTNRLFNSTGLTREVATKQVSLMFDGI